jgi:predicted component of type VI protein secretion system
MKIGDEALRNIPDHTDVNQASAADPLSKLRHQAAAQNIPNSTPLDEQAVVDHAIGSAQDVSGATESLKNRLDSLSEMSDLDSMRLQQFMDNKSKFEEELSNILKKQDDTASQILKNLKG